MSKGFQMKAVKGIGVAGMIAFGVVACAAQPANEENAPEIVSDSVDEQDEGYSYNGWQQIAWYEWNYCSQAPNSASQTFVRSYGDATRGGGACYVKSTGVGCSSDSTCLANAVATYGGSAYGYCFAGSCYSRPGSQASYCSLSPNRGPSTVNVPNAFSGDIWDGTNHLLLCMTKTAGPNPACGGTSTSQYMRNVVGLNIFYGSC
jgi:hypothetical protein